ncbi:MAG: carbohydrate ABC transporter permease [Candidatus Bipolaricaulis sp.]|nr:carbohydrate ABC transporter permease [Candidatus Bipolaricaulis sp.]MDD5647207.1 carbohydrate ABC transporter permease [Candidatus Bipolaricaulis sp.]
MRMSVAKQVLLHVVVVLMLAGMAFPVLLLVFNSLKAEADIFASPMGPPHAVTWANFRRVLSETSFAVNLRNSAIVAFSTVILSVVVTAPAGYALSRFKFLGRTFFSMWLLATQAFPGIIMVLGLFTVLTTYGLINRLPGLIIMHTSFSMPFSIWLLKGYFDKISVEIEEAARIDGCTRLQSLVKIVFPLAVPGLLAVATFSLLLSWNEFFFALVLMRDNAHYTLPVYLARFLGSGGVVQWGPLSAAALLITIPVFVLFLLGQKYLVSGLTGGAIK